MENKINPRSSIEKLVSIIVPVYKAENCISTCIQSILKQSYKEFELILVIDGSPDKSASICHRFEEQDSRIHVIEKENGGVSSARNQGIMASKGEYLCFVDADDEIAPTMIERMIQCVNNNEDLCICGFSVIGSSIILNDTTRLKELSNNVTKEELINAIIDTSKNRIFGYAWRCLYRKSVLLDNGFYFPETIRISEDYMFFLKYVFHSNRICILPEELYLYKINESSATAKYMPTLHSDMHTINEWMKSEVCPVYPSTQVGYHCCESNTFLRSVQNLCRQGTPYTLQKRIHLAYRTKKKYRYERELWFALTRSKNLSLKNKVSYFSLLVYQEWLYIILFSIKNKTLWG